MAKLSQVNLSHRGRRLIENISKYNSIFPYLVVIILFACFVWYRFFPLFNQSPFFLIYNAIVYLALVAVLCSSYFYTKKLSSLLKKLIGLINPEEKGF